MPSKNDPRRRPSSGGASSSAAVKDNEAFAELIKQAQSDMGWRDKAKQNRPQAGPMQVSTVLLILITYVLGWLLS